MPRTLIFPLLLLFLEFTGNISNDMYLPALPEIASGFNVSVDIAQLSVSVWIMGGASLLWLIGPLSDRYSRRLVLLSAGGLFCLASVACALAYNITFLIIARFLQGMAVNATMIVSYAAINELYDDEEATTWMGWMGVSAVIAPLIGPLFGSALLLFTSWRTLFWILAILGALATAALSRAFPFCEIDSDENALKLKRLVEVYRMILSSKRFSISSILYGLGYSITMSWIIMSPTLLMVRYGYTPMGYALWQMPVFALFTLGALMTKPISRKKGRPWLIKTFLLWAFSFAALLLFASYFADIPILIGLVALALFGRGTTFAPIGRITLSTFTIKRGAATAMFYTIVLATCGILTTILALIPDSFTTLALSLMALSLGSILLNQVLRKIVS